MGWKNPAAERWYYKNREGILSRSRERKKEYNTQYRLSGRRRALENKNRYNLTEQQFELMWAAQEGKCAICRSDLLLRKGGYAIDHNHTTGKVRGILCAPCNFGLGGFKDLVSNLLKAVEYVESHDG